MRYDVKGRRYIDTPSKYYFSDLGLRNARLNFRQNEKTHLMENMIYNELLYRGFNVDVGVVVTETTSSEGKRQKVQLEIDFVCNQGSRRYYIQSAYKMDTDEKRRQECLSLSKVDDSFKKVVIVADDQLVHHDDQGITTMNVEKMLKEKGHEVAVYAMQYPENEESEWSKYWPSNMTKLKAFTRPFGDGEVKRKFGKLLDDFKPDVVHLNNIHTQLSQ